MNTTEALGATTMDLNSTMGPTGPTTQQSENFTSHLSTIINDVSIPDESTSVNYSQLTTIVTNVSSIPTMDTTYFRHTSITSTTKQDFSQTDDVTSLFKWHGAEILFLVFVLVLSVVGNIMVMYIYHFRWKRSNFSLFIEVLALLDLINGCTTVPLFIIVTVNDRIHNFTSICQAASYIAMATGVSSGICLLTIAFDRNKKICKPLKHEMPLPLTKKLCLGAVIAGSLVAIPSVLLYGKKDMKVKDEGTIITITECFFTDRTMRSPLLFVFTAVLGLIFTAVLICLSVLYISIWKALRIHLQHRESLGSRRPSVSSRHQVFRSQRSSARLFFFVTVAFFSSYFPYFVVMTAMMIGDMPVMTVTVKSLTDIAKFSPLLSNVINPIIYSATSTRFRKECIAILFLCGSKLQKRRWKRQGSGSSLRHHKTHTSSVTEEMAERRSKRKIAVKYTENECSSSGNADQKPNDHEQ